MARYHYRIYRGHIFCLLGVGYDSLDACREGASVALATSNDFTHAAILMREAGIYDREAIVQECIYPIRTPIVITRLRIEP